MLHRSTSSRRSKGSRNMTNFSHSPVIVGSKGRRASVATDKPVDLPHTSPRGTMERQRSPRGSFVPDIALDTESDSPDESINHRIVLDRDQYGGSRNVLNHKISRSPRNSLIPDDYYRSPRNGARSPRNSLIPDAIVIPDMIYGSRHSLVPEVAMSPRNSLVPDLTHNRSPRNSMVPLTGSRTSLMSENGNVTISRSPRHSLVPNTPRSPRGSITNMELVDRSPQNRSPRGSIASECLSQSPRNSIVPYEVCRSSRGSIGVNDVPRGPIGFNEEENRSPRRSINPDTIDRSPRGSLSGLQDRRPIKTNFIAQDPRRASADQGINGSRNSSPYRQREGNSGSVKSGGSIVHVNLGFGPSNFEDSRRASSSVSQVSGDESRRLFTTTAKIPEKTMENGNLGVITYGSVVFQLKDANIEANSTCDFVFRALRVVSKTRIVTICLTFLFTVPVLMLIIGRTFVDDCPLETRIPTYMVIGGTLGTILMVLIIYGQIRSRRREVLMVPPPTPEFSLAKVVTVALACFLIIWFFVGNYWILRIMWPPFQRPMFSPDMYCNKTLYIFSLVQLGVVYFIFASTLFLVIALAAFRILACPLPGRYK